MTTLITGATGFIGRRLLRAGGRALVRVAGRIPNAVAGDLLDPPSLAAACAGIETVFHCAGYAHAFTSSDPDAHWRINYEGTRNLVEAAGRAGVRRFVFLSSVKAMAEPGDECVDEDWPGEPVTPYGQAKRAAENAVLEAGVQYGMHVVNLRLAMVYGRGGRGIQDAIRAVLRAPTLRWRVPASVLRAAGRLNGRLGEIVDRLIGSACYSPARIERELGWRARVGLEAGLREMLTSKVYVDCKYL